MTTEMAYLYEFGIHRYFLYGINFGQIEYTKKSVKMLQRPYLIKIFLRQIQETIEVFVTHQVRHAL